MRTIAVIFILVVSTGFLLAIEEKPNVLDNGGGTVTGGSYENLASIGQAVICMSSGGSYQNCAGFIGSLMGSTMDIKEDPSKDPGKPEEFAVGSAYPNPFNEIARFNIEVPTAGLLIARFYDISGRLVYGENKELLTGNYKLDFDAGGLPSGTYLYRISMGNKDFSGKVILIK